MFGTFYGRGLLQKEGFEGGGEFGLSGEFFGELSEDNRTVEVTAGAIAGIRKRVQRYNFFYIRKFYSKLFKFLLKTCNIFTQI